MQAGRHLVDIPKPRRHAGDLALVGRHLLHHPERVTQKLLDVDDSMRVLALQNVKNQLFRLFQNRLRVVRRLIAHVYNGRAGLNQSAQQRLLRHNVSILRDISRRRHRRRNARQIGHAADRVKPALPLKRVRHGYKVNRPVCIKKLEHNAVNSAVMLEVEIIFPNALADGGDTVMVDQNTAQNRLLRLHAVGHRPAR